MAKYTFKYWFEWGFFNEDICPCLWASDDVTKEKYGYSVALKSLPISEELRIFWNCQEMCSQKTPKI